MKQFSIASIASTALIAACVLVSTCHAGIAARKDGDQGIVYEDTKDGIEIEWSANGREINRMSSTWRHPVMIADRPGLNKGYVIAEEKAKAAIVRYMNQMVSSERQVREISQDVTNSSAKTVNSANSISTETTRNMTESLLELTSSFAVGRLPGIIILEKAYSPKDGEVIVTVGWSQKTRAAAQAMRNQISDTNPPSTHSPADANGASREQKAERRTSKQIQW